MIESDSAPRPTPASSPARLRGIGRQVTIWLALLAITAVSLWGITYRLNEPGWQSGHHGYVLSEYPQNALNYLRFGWLQTGCGLVTNLPSVEPPAKFVYRVDHGPVTPLLISLGYVVFGTAPWVARMVAVLIFVGISATTGWLALRLTGKPWIGVLAYAFASLCPLTLIYGRMPNPHNLAVLPSLLVFACYWKWHETGRRGWLIGVLAVLTVGVFTDWIVYFTVPAVLGHALVTRTRKLGKAWFVTLAAAPFVLFGVYVGWTYWLAGDFALRKLLGLFLMRTASVARNANAAAAAQFSMAQYWEATRRFFDYHLTNVVELLAASFAIGLIITAIRRRMRPQHWFVVALFVFAAAHNLVFRNRVYFHDMIMVGHFVPVFAIMAAWALGGAVSALWRRGWLRPVALLLITAVAVLFYEQSSGAFAWADQGAKILRGSYFAARTIHEKTSPAEVVLIDGRVPYSENVSEDPLLYALDRRVLMMMPGNHRGRYRAKPSRTSTGSTYADQLATLMDERPDVAAVLVKDTDCSWAPEDRLAMLLRYPRQAMLGYSIFWRTGQAPPAISKIAASPQRPAAVQVGGLEYLGCDLPERVVREPVVIGLWRRHVQPFAPQMPEHYAAVRVRHYWRKIADDEADYQFRTTLASTCSDAVLAPVDSTLTSLLPTSRWPVGAIIRDEVEIEVPADVRLGEYTAQLEVSNLVPADTPDAPPARTPRAFATLGRVLIAPPTEIASGFDPPLHEDDRRCQGQLGDGPELCGARIDARDAEGPLITTWWRAQAHTADAQLGLRIERGAQATSIPIALPSPLFWQRGAVYAAQTRISRWLQPGAYRVVATAQDSAGKVETQVLGDLTWAPGGGAVLRALGRVDGQPLQRVRPYAPLEVSFYLTEPGDLELVVGWTGQSQFPETRPVVQVAESGDAWRDVSVFSIARGERCVSTLQLPGDSLRAGVNRLRIAIRFPTFLGWRRSVVRAWPAAADLLRSSFTPYAGWIDSDFVQIRSRGGAKSPAHALTGEELDRRFSNGLAIESVALTPSLAQVIVESFDPQPGAWKLFAHVIAAPDDPTPLRLLDLYLQPSPGQMAAGGSYPQWIAIDPPLEPGQHLKLGFFDERDPDFRRAVDADGHDGVVVPLR